MKYTITYFPFDNSSHEKLIQAHNRHLLALFVEGVECLDATTFADSDIPKDVKHVLTSRLNNDEGFGTVESYANGYYNIFVRVYRKSSLDDTYLDGFFKVWVEK
jgi:isocitrate dehydrogenase kinase/phosphatase